MISQQQTVLVRNLVESDVFESIISEIRQDLFEEWVNEPNLDHREKIYNQSAALELILETIIAKATEKTSGDTNA